MSGERGNLFQVPFEIGKGVEKVPEKYICTKGLVYNAIMAKYIGPTNPNDDST